MTRRREDIINELVELIIASLSHYNIKELEAFLDASVASDQAVVTQGQGIRAPNDAVTAVLHPSASKSEIVQGLRQLADQLDLEVEEIDDQIRIDPTSVTEAIYTSSKLLN